MWAQAINLMERGACIVTLFYQHRLSRVVVDVNYEGICRGINTDAEEQL
jgi:hypothetical protein